MKNRAKIKTSREKGRQTREKTGSGPTRLVTPVLWGFENMIYHFSAQLAVSTLSAFSLSLSHESLAGSTLLGRCEAGACRFWV